MEETKEIINGPKLIMISIIIPTLNEQENISRLLTGLMKENSIDYEIIIVDGGSKDRTLEIVNQFPIIICKSLRGRGEQLCEGFKRASGDIILFLHADSTISGSPLKAIYETLDRDPKLIGGNFSLKFDGKDDFSLWLNGFYKWLRDHNIYYGDSGIFIRRNILEKIGGISNRALMEDYDLVKRMEKIGPTCNIKNPTLITSSRRFYGRSKWSIILGWVKIHFLYYLGFNDDYLAKAYDSERTKETPL